MFDGVIEDDPTYWGGYFWRGMYSPYFPMGEIGRGWIGRAIELRGTRADPWMWWCAAYVSTCCEIDDALVVNGRPYEILDMLLEGVACDRHHCEGYIWVASYLRGKECVRLLDGRMVSRGGLLRGACRAIIGWGGGEKLRRRLETGLMRVLVREWAAELDEVWIGRREVCRRVLRLQDEDVVIQEPVPSGYGYARGHRFHTLYDDQRAAYGMLRRLNKKEKVVWTYRDHGEWCWDDRARAPHWGVGSRRMDALFKTLFLGLQRLRDTGVLAGCHGSVWEDMISDGGWVWGDMLELGHFTDG